MLGQNTIDTNLSKIMLDACIRVPAYVDKLSTSVNQWMKDENIKYFLERDHSYQLSLLAIKTEDWMKGLYYIDRDLKNMDFGSSSHAQHHLVQKIMKNFECRQFLSIIKKIGFEDEVTLKSNIINSIEGWLSRTPNVVYDPINIWDDIMTSRIIYLDTYTKHITGFSDDIKANPKIADIRSLLYLQTANGAKEMVLYDSCEKYLKFAVDECINLHSCTPLIVDLKIRQYRIKYLNEELDQNVLRLKKIEEVIKRQKHSNSTELSVSKLALLIGDIKQLVMEVVLHNYKEELITEDSYYADAMEKTFKIYETILIKAQDNKIEDHILTETHMKFALFADNILFSPYEVTQKALEEKNIEKGMLANILVKSSFQALNRGASNSSMLIPRMLEALTNYPKE